MHSWDSKLLVGCKAPVDLQIDFVCAQFTDKLSFLEFYQKYHVDKHY